MDFRGQVSLESLLLWSALAAALALFTPVFAHAIEANVLLVQTHQFTLFSSTISATISELSFSSPGARQTIHVPSLENFSSEIDSNTLILRWENHSFAHPKLHLLESSVPLSGNADSKEKEWVFTRTEKGITIR